MPASIQQRLSSPISFLDSRRRGQSSLKLASQRPQCGARFHVFTHEGTRSWLRRSLFARNHDHYHLLSVCFDLLPSGWPSQRNESSQLRIPNQRNLFLYVLKHVWFTLQQTPLCSLWISQAFRRFGDIQSCLPWARSSPAQGVKHHLQIHRIHLRGQREHPRECRCGCRASLSRCKGCWKRPETVIGRWQVMACW